MNLTLIFVRHAHRDTGERSIDNGIDEKGLKQVTDLLDDFAKGTLPKSNDFRSSPKKRCIETLTPLAALNGAKVTIEDALDEQSPTESTQEFRQRIFNFLKKLSSQLGVIYLCSHGDWLPEAIQDLTGNWADIKKGGYVICEKSNGKWKSR